MRNTLCDGLSSPRPDQAARSGPVVYPTLEPYRAGLIWRYKARGRVRQRLQVEAARPAAAPSVERLVAGLYERIARVIKGDQ